MDKIQTVSEFLRLLRGKINNAFGMVWVGGEVSNCVRAASGHFYFSLKDGSSQIRCVFFKFKARGSESIGLRDGIEVEVFAKTTIYEPRGDLQLVVEGIRLAGKGRLFQEYQTLKLKLQKEGLFNAERKKKIPMFPKSIGVVTSEKGAALIDVLAVLKKRMPSIAVIIYPTRVQGDGAAVEIRNSLKLALSRSEVDVLIICRGGGSFEDLWPFNDESLARAVVESHIPIVSGIGHATDFTILDFVADANATTPTAAAAAVSPNYDDLILDLNKFKRSMLRVIENIIEQKVQLIDFIGQRLASPSEKATKKIFQLRILKNQLNSSMHAIVSVQKSELKIQLLKLRARNKFFLFFIRRTVNLSQRLKKSQSMSLSKEQKLLDTLSRKISLFDMSSILQRGFSLVIGSNGAIVKSSEEVSIGEKVSINFSKGKANAIISDGD